MNTRLIVVIFFLLASCKEDLPARHYKSPVEATGGFYNFSLNLKSNGKLELTLEVSIQVKQSELGEEWESKSKYITGKWDIKNELINCSFNESKSDIDSIFINTDFNNVDKPVIAFSQKFDTAYIYGIPCLVIENE